MRSASEKARRLPPKVFTRGVDARRLLSDMCLERGVSIDEVRTQYERSPIALEIRAEFSRMTADHNIGSVIVARVLGVSPWTVQYWRNPVTRAKKQERNRNARRNRAEARDGSGQGIAP
jgi:hypothetical protein